MKKENQSSAFFERLIDSKIYELYMLELIKSSECEIFKHLKDLPALDGGNISKNLRTIESLFIELSDINHPIQKAMYFMDTIEEIAIIEGKKS